VVVSVVIAALRADVGDRTLTGWYDRSLSIYVVVRRPFGLDVGKALTHDVALPAAAARRERVRAAGDRRMGRPVAGAPAGAA